jgi:prepilin-type N-terminal cleavage/methylation domain-containing protein
MMKRPKGLTLIELAIGTALLAVLSVVLLRLFSGTQDGVKGVEDTTEARSEAIGLLNTILSMGRVANNCRSAPCLPLPVGRTPVPLAPGQTCLLQCDVTVNDNVVDFAFVADAGANAVLHRELRTAGAGWTTQRTFRAPSVQRLIVCGDAQLNVPLACPLRAQAGVPDPVEVEFRTNFAAGAIPANRFYRVGVGFGAAVGGGTLNLQSSFFVRNPLLGFQNAASLNGSLRMMSGSK